MEINTMNISILLAAGHGLRMNNETPKQFLKIKGKEIFKYSLETFLNNKNIDLIILCVDENHMKWWEPFLNEYNSKKIVICNGGENRLDSFLLSMKFLENLDLKMETKIITHDIARPFVSSILIDEHINLLDKHSIVNTILPIADSIVYLDENKKIEKYISRDYTYKIQTPQSFLYKEFFNIDWSLVDKKFATDICYLFFVSNIAIFNHLGSKNNIKITDKDDFEFFS
ncbi:MAG: IspD/TarI family cytidylyltransferase [Malacoplasma sp.]